MSYKNCSLFHRTTGSLGWDLMACQGVEVGGVAEGGGVGEGGQPAT